MICHPRRAYRSIVYMQLDRIPISFEALARGLSDWTRRSGPRFDKLAKQGCPKARRQSHGP